MFRKNYLVFVLMIAAILIGSTAVFAQNATISGRVQTADEKGKKTPVANVLIEAYRTDTKTVEPVSVKTDAEGKFKVEGLPSGKEFALAVSGESFEPTVATDVKSGATDVEITLKPGDGNKPSADLVRQTLLASGKLKLSAEEIAEEEKAMKQREANIAKTQGNNAAVKRLLEEGSKAYEKKDFDLAVSKFDEGYQVNPEFLGSAPVLLNSKGLSLRERAIKYYNAGRTSTETQVKLDNYSKASKDFSDGIEAYYESWMIIKNSTDAQKAEVKNYEESKVKALSQGREIVYYSALTGNANAEQISKVKELIEAYVAFESDKTKKNSATSTLADYYRLSADYDTATTLYRQVLTASPNEPGALYGLGMTFFTVGYNDEGIGIKAKLQESANYLKRFIDTAPADQKILIKSATDTLDILKDGENISPKKN